MQGFTIIDGAVAAVILLSAILAYSRGLVRETLAIAGWVGAAVVGFMFAPQAEPLVAEIPLLGEFIADSCELGMITAFTGVFAAALIVFSFFIPLFSAMIQRSALGGVDQGLGFLFGALRGGLLVAIALFVYNTMMASQGIAMVDNSRSAAVFERLSERIEQRDPQATLGWITGRYEALVANCAG